MSVDGDEQAELAATQTLGEGHLLFFSSTASLAHIESALVGDLQTQGFVVEKASDDVLFVLPERQAVEREATRAKLLKPVAPELSGNAAGVLERFDSTVRPMLFPGCL
jgi:hypothetical protein